MKKIIALIIVLMIIQLEGLLATPLQPVDSIGVKSLDGKKFIEYKIEAHEGWYGIARKYGISYNDLRNANKDTSDQLSVGQVILVPVGVNAMSIYKGKAGIDKQGEPVYHVVKAKETLFAISKKYKVTKDEIKKWNHLESESLKNGEQLIVGYKKVKENQVQTKVAEKTDVKVEKKDAVEKAEPAGKKTETKPDSTAIVKTSSDTKTIRDTLTVTYKSPVSRREVTEQGIATWIEDENINPNKYFALHRTASTGSIIRLTNRMNKRTVFVKVVGKLPDTGDNENVIIKVSKASAEKLGVRDPRFQCDLSYGVSEK